MSREAIARSCRAVPGSRSARCAAALVAAAVAVAPCSAQTWRWEGSVGLQETATNNVNLDPDSSRRSDLVTQITPVLVVREASPRTLLEGTVAVPILLYARTGGENNSVYPSLNLFGSLDVYNRILFLEGAVTVSQQFFTPFGAQPADFSNATDNRYRTTTYRVTPYLQGEGPGGWTYELRNNNVWSNLTGAPIDTSNSRYTEWIARVSTAPQRQLGVAANYNYTDVVFNDQEGSLVTQIGRVAPFYNVNPQLRLDATAGYEHNSGFLTSYSGAVYGVGFRWRPTERTSVVGSWEHRYFGSSYFFSFDHRMPRTVWNVTVSRNTTTYPQQLANLTAGTDVAAFLDSLYLSSVPDPATRQQIVQTFLSERGLPSTLANPVTLYAQQIVLQQQQLATFGIIGARNTILFSVYNVKNEPISVSGTPLPPIFSLGNDNTQTGGSVVWTNRLTQAVNLVTSLEAFRTVTNGGPTAKTNQGIARITLTAPITPRTTGFVGARYQQLTSDVAQEYNEAAAFAGVVYTFK